jgi:hypothetical protein
MRQRGPTSMIFVGPHRLSIRVYFSCARNIHVCMIMAGRMYVSFSLFVASYHTLSVIILPINARKREITRARELEADP